MSRIEPRGSKASRLWVLLQEPLSSDAVKGYLLSGGLGFVFAKMLKEAGLDIDDCYCFSRISDLEHRNSFAVVENTLNEEKPPFIITIGQAGQHLLPELRGRDPLAWKGQLAKYCGSLMQSPLLHFPHYVMPLRDIDFYISDWTERNVSVYVDLQKLRDEIVYWKTHGVHQPLPARKLIYGDLSLNEILSHFNRFSKAPLLSNDIESVYPRKGSSMLYHPGYPITVGLADTIDFGISFNLFRDDPKESRVLWRALDELFHTVPCLGQNFFNFDRLFYEALGFSIDLSKIQDTLLRHHILWPELPHKLQFLTRQYTREPYYKDEGHGWSIKKMDKLRRYNCLDVCVTLEVFNAQEEEFNQKPYLR